MKMGIPPEWIPESLVGYDHSGTYLFAGNFPVEIADHGEYHFRNFRKKLSVVEEEHSHGIREGEGELSVRKTQQDFLIQVFGKEKCSLLATGGTQIKPLTGEGTEIVVTTVRITAADTGYPLPVVAAGEKVLAHRLDPFEAKLTECIGVLLIILAAEIGEMMLEDLMEGVSSPRKIIGLLLFQYGSILYTHIEYYCENGTDASGKIK